MTLITPWPLVLDVSGKKNFYTQLKDLGINHISPFEALTLNTLQQLLDAIILLQNSPLRGQRAISPSPHSNEGT